MAREKLVRLVHHMLGHLVQLYGDRVPRWIGSALVENVEFEEGFLMALDIIMQLPSLLGSLVLLQNDYLYSRPRHFGLINKVPCYFLAQSSGAVLVQWVSQHSGNVRHGIAFWIVLHPGLHHWSHLVVAEPT